MYATGFRINLKLKHDQFYSVFHDVHENVFGCQEMSILKLLLALKSVKIHILCEKSAKEAVFFTFRFHFRNPSLKIHLKMYLKFAICFS